MTAVLPVASSTTSSSLVSVARKREHGIALHRESAVVLHKAVLQDRDLCEVAMNIQSDDSHGRSPAVMRYTAEARGQHDNYGFALAAQPGRSKGQPVNNPSSQLIV